MTVSLNVVHWLKKKQIIHFYSQIGIGKTFNWKICLFQFIFKKSGGQFLYSTVSILNYNTI